MILFSRVSKPLVTATLLLATACIGSAWADDGGVVQRAGTEGCLSETGTGGLCADVDALDGSALVIVSPDGLNVYSTASNSFSVAAFDRDPVTGSLTATGCVSEDGTGGLCDDGVALNQARGVAISPDGNHLYVASEVSDAVSIFDRDGSGDLSQLSGLAGCISETGTALACDDGVALVGARDVAVSPDGTNVYIASGVGGAIAVFDRDDMTGELTQKFGTDACVSDDGTGGACEDGTGLAFVASVAVSPDGAHVYVASFGSSAVVVLDRDSVTGALDQSSCVSDAPLAGCTTAKALSGAFALAFSPAGTELYVASWTSSGIAIFDRDPVTGVLTQKADPDGCINNGGALGCANGHDMLNANGVAVSPDGSTVYVSSFNSSALVVLDRDSLTGGLTQRTGPTGCLSEDGSGGSCADGVALANMSGVAVSPDSASVYGAAFISDSVIVLDRVVFADGFEGGSTASWSATSP